MTNNATKITTLIFDVDDTLYDVGTGFTAHRNGEIVQQYMVDHLKFSSLSHAKAIRDEYFEQHHATAKALTVAQQEGRFPPEAPTFDTKHLAEYWATHLDYSKLGPPKTELKKQLEACPSSLTLVAFSNGPRAYVKKVLEALGLFELFGEERLFAVDDVLPHCKPEAAAFEKIFENIGHPSPESCIMVEDSMKNIRQAKKLGMKTVLITGKSEEGRILPGDRPEATDPSVDVSLATIEEFARALPGLWETPAVFDPRPRPSVDSS
jgi:putative hydrolase of the HAD superfamily